MDEKQNRGPENKNNSTVWFALIIVASLAIAMFLIFKQNGSQTLEYSDFVKLLKITQYDETHDQLVAGTEQHSPNQGTGAQWANS